MHCHRCHSPRLLKLDKRPQDHDVYRCRQCGFLFSPPPDQEDGPPISGGRAEAAPRDGTEVGPHE